MTVGNSEPVRLATLPIVVLPTGLLTPSMSPREPLVDHGYGLLLAAVLDDLPPIVVHLETGAIVDGVHRWHAYRSRGRARIRARAFSGSTSEALLLGIRLNLTCGKPLSRKDRRRAIGMVLEHFADRSDRWVADACGASHTTVGDVRRRTEPGLQPVPLERRLGRDGRRRLVASTAPKARQSAQIAQRERSLVTLTEMQATP